MNKNEKINEKITGVALVTLDAAIFVAAVAAAASAARRLCASLTAK